MLSSFLTGLGGTFYAFYLFSLQPNAVFGIPLSVEIIIRPVVGGAGHAARAASWARSSSSPLAEVVAHLLQPERLVTAPTSSSTACC